MIYFFLISASLELYPPYSRDLIKRTFCEKMYDIFIIIIFLEQSAIRELKHILKIPYRKLKQT